MDSNDLILIKLHENKKYLDDCCDLLNSYWPRSQTARLHSLNKSNDNYPCNYILINSKNSKLIGHVCVLIPESNNQSKSKTALIESLIIHKDYRRKGLGRILMDKLENLLIKDQFKILTLRTIDQVSFYESIGFKMKNQIKSLAIDKNKSRYLQQQSFSIKTLDKQLNNINLNLNENKNDNLPSPPPLPINQSNNNYILEYNLEKTIN